MYRLRGVATPRVPTGPTRKTALAWTQRSTKRWPRRFQRATRSRFTCPRYGNPKGAKSISSLSAAARERPELASPTGLGENEIRDITAALNRVLADVFALYLKTKNFHWHGSGPHSHEYHLLFDEQADQLFAMTDPLAERVQQRRVDDPLRRPSLPDSAG
jgi:Ferritin-like domain